MEVVKNEEVGRGGGGGALGRPGMELGRWIWREKVFFLFV